MSRRGKKVQINKETVQRWKSIKETRQPQTRQERQQESKQSGGDMFLKLQGKVKDIGIDLSIEKRMIIMKQHPALASICTAFALYSSMDQKVRVMINKCHQPKLMKLYDIFWKKVQAKWNKMSNQRRNMVMKMENTKLKEHPRDVTNTIKSEFYGEQIRTLQEQFQRKVNFKDYADQQLINYQKEIQQTINQTSQKVPTSKINAQFLPYYNQKMEAISITFEENERKCNKKLIQLMKSAAQSNKLEIFKKTEMRRKRMQVDAHLKKSLCTKLGNSMGYTWKLHDAFGDI